MPVRWEIRLRWQNGFDGRSAFFRVRRVADDDPTRRINDKTARYCTHALSASPLVSEAAHSSARAKERNWNSGSPGAPPRPSCVVRRKKPCPRASPSASVLALHTRP